MNKAITSTMGLLAVLYYSHKQTMVQDFDHGSAWLRKTMYCRASLITIFFKFVFLKALNNF